MRPGFALAVLATIALHWHPLLAQDANPYRLYLPPGVQGQVGTPDPPHWGNGIDCGSCHVAHQGADVQLTNQVGNANLCMSCHNPAGLASNKPFSDADRAVPGTSGTSHAWDVPATNSDYGADLPINPELRLRIYDGNIVCSTCHNQHKQTYSPFLRASNYQNAMCKDCHAVRNVGSYRDDPNNRGSHPVGIPYPTDDSRFFASPQNPALPLVDPDRVECTTCHQVHFADSGGANGGAGDGYILRVPNDDNLCKSCHAYQDHQGMGCLTCHDVHDPQRQNIFIVRNAVDTPNSGTRSVVFTAETGANSFADGDSQYDGICEVCHTATKYHRNDGTGDHSHNAGKNCTQCHTHENQFHFEHPTANTDCSNCHTDMLAAHNDNCQACHPVDFTATIIGPIGTWNGECSACHNPGVAETGNLQTPTKGHRCIVCHGQQMETGNFEGFHKEHIDKANCVVCHGFIPNTGTAIGSDNRDVCAICHVGGKNDAVQSIHKRHVPKGLSCLECHNGSRPPVDVTDGAPVGNARNVCQACHSDQSPSAFQNDFERLHKEHADKRLDCGACHKNANLQDDRVPMPSIDDPVRQQVNRSGFNECAHCHAGGKSAGTTEVHNKHVEGMWQWCYNCHEGNDGRPLGTDPPVTQPSEACQLCHSGRSYNDSSPFNIHKKHVSKKQNVKCYACHQAQPPIFDWPQAWMQ
ncbi:MAG: cytochrome c3 family protein [candidate division KSB1 bacterium]|nr:cytochrome c3 family protein [candidate division KSB1 bacterium]